MCSLRIKKATSGNSPHDSRTHQFMETDALPPNPFINHLHLFVLLSGRGGSKGGKRSQSVIKYIWIEIGRANQGPWMNVDRFWLFSLYFLFLKTKWTNFVVLPKGNSKEMLWLGVSYFWEEGDKRQKKVHLGVAVKPREWTEVIDCGEYPFLTKINVHVTIYFSPVDLLPTGSKENDSK